VTHVGRVRGAEDGIEFGATVEGVKALGLWSQGSSFRNSYNRTLPVDAMLALAYFNGERKDNYFIPRDYLGTFNLQCIHQQNKDSQMSRAAGCPYE
jgi:hypothetical protein